MDLKKEIKREDITGVLGEIADVIGVDNAISLMEFAGGMPLYIPLPKLALSKVRTRRIWEEFKAGADVKDLARKYGVSTRWVRMVIKEGYERARKKSR